MRSDGGSTATAAGGAAAAPAMTGSVKKKSPSEPSSHCGTSAGTGVTPPHSPVTASSAAACAAAACPATWRNVSPTWPGWLSAAISRRFTCSCLTVDSISVRGGPIPVRRSDFFLLAFPMGTKPIKDGHQPGPASLLIRRFEVQFSGGAHRITWGFTNPDHFYVPGLSMLSP